VHDAEGRDGAPALRQKRAAVDTLSNLSFAAKEDKWDSRDSTSSLAPCPQRPPG
jgi:hypothetical protein